MGGNFVSQAGFLQFEIVFGNPAANLEKVARLLEELAPEKDALLVLPELWAVAGAAVFERVHKEAGGPEQRLLAQDGAADRQHLEVGDRC